MTVEPGHASLPEKQKDDVGDVRLDMDAQALPGSENVGPGFDGTVSTMEPSEACAAKYVMSLCE